MTSVLTFNKKEMQQKVGHIALVVKDYDEAIQFYTQQLGFELVEDTILSIKLNGFIVILDD